MLLDASHGHMQFWEWAWAGVKRAVSVRAPSSLLSSGADELLSQSDRNRSRVPPLFSSSLENQRSLGPSEPWANRSLFPDAQTKADRSGL